MMIIIPPESESIKSFDIESSDFADNATNICEEIIYMAEGKIIKHRLGE